MPTEEMIGSDSEKVTDAGAQDNRQEPEAIDGDGHDRGKQSNRELGKKGEDAAARYLTSNDFIILERNWRCGFGEADIIAKDSDGTLCFIEVKTRSNLDAGLPEEAITPQKQERYEKIALCYMTQVEWKDDMPVRFDAIAICAADNHRALLRHHRGCFDGGC